jgi:hypothetical protein
MNQKISRLSPETEAMFEIYLGYARACSILEQYNHAHKWMVEEKEHAALRVAHWLHMERFCERCHFERDYCQCEAGASK